MADWGFYGRKDDLARGQRILRNEKFRCIRVSGRRKVGKSSFIEKIHASCPERRQVFINLSTYGEIMNISASEAVQRLEKVFRDAGQKPVKGFSETDHPADRFHDMLVSALSTGTDVIIDEFQFCDSSWMEYAVKGAIDRMLSRERTKKIQCGSRGKPIVSGSHQQKLMEMFMLHRPLYGRPTDSFHLRQWSTGDMLEMASDQKILDHPRKLLSLYTAFSGMPGLWEQAFDEENGFQHWHGYGDGWQKNFIDWYRTALERNSDMKWNNAVYIELPPERRDILRLLASKRRGFTFKEIQERSGLAEDILYQHLWVLENHLEMIGPGGNFLEPDMTQRLCDATVRFQMDVTGRKKDGFGTEAMNRNIEWMKALEGYSLEHMAESWLAGQSGIRFAKAAQFLPGLPDIDIIGFKENRNLTVPVLGGCRRDPNAHRTEKLNEDFRKFMTAMADMPESADTRRQFQRYLERPNGWNRILVSPLFTENQRKRYAGNGFRCVSIQDMARDFGIEPRKAPDGPVQEDSFFTEP